jgi:CO/xanthine dehydrogenase FAD-binding subunit
MRSALSRLELLRPRNLGEALVMMQGASEHPLTPLAGGTDLFVYLNFGTLGATRFIDLWPLRELRGIRPGRHATMIGALTTFAELREHPAVRRRYPSLAGAAREIGGLQNQNRATLGGNLANASPAGDTLPVLLALDAVLELVSVRGARSVPVDEFFLGYRKTALAPDELIAEIVLPLPPRGAFQFFRKVGTRRAQSISKVVFAGLLTRDRRGRVGDVRLAYGSVAPIPVRARRAEGALRGRQLDRDAVAAARAALAEAVRPIDDIRSTRDYRAEVAGNLLAQFLAAAVEAR